MGQAKRKEWKKKEKKKDDGTDEDGKKDERTNLKYLKND